MAFPLQVMFFLIIKIKKSVYITGAGFIFGEEKNKKAFAKDLKKQDWIINYEQNKDFGIAVIKEPLFTEIFWHPKIIQISPIIIHPKEKRHIWSFASFDRKLLEQVLETAEKFLGAKIIKFKQEKITNISFTRLLPELTDNQKKALEIALHHGYYDYPKKVKMEKLAKEMKISYSTFQAHLKKAEGKILPEIYKEL
ncbi:hypothetical protein CMI37_34090 [Candidatus Pacearchaeota archaeon]|nr:hypothetical protein [Candidatus Pacearchaeota archaeon]|tara:strand:+ start:54 stop:641 length:588 start_codon:yes stop_codon:yes gene_type:complete